MKGPSPSQDPTPHCRCRQKWRLCQRVRPRMTDIPQGQPLPFVTNPMHHVAAEHRLSLQQATAGWAQLGMEKHKAATPISPMWTRQPPKRRAWNSIANQVATALRKQIAAPTQAWQKHCLNAAHQRANASDTKFSALATALAIMYTAIRTHTQHNL